MENDGRLKVAIVAAEIAPWAKVGGLADVIAALPPALAEAGAAPCVILPGYRALLSAFSLRPVAGGLSLMIGEEREQFAILRASDPAGVPIYLIDHPGFFDREGIYGERAGDYPDNLRRFIFFGRAAAIAARIINPDVVHAHDWHAATAPIVMRADPALEKSFRRTLLVFTVHNLAFQGIFPARDFPLLGLDPSNFSIERLEFYGNVNLMKGALMLADAASTVSPSYAREVTSSAELGFGLEGVLRSRGERFRGILNGADYREWDPASDPNLAAHYSPARPQGKLACIRDLRQWYRLPEREGQPLIGMVTRMTAQKGLDLVRDALGEILGLGAQLIMLSSGDAELERFFEEAERRQPDALRVVLDFNNALAHRIQAGSDIFLMPSRFEPCGLTQMYALRYGTVPVVRATGGLRDTVSEFDPASGSGSGFTFEPYRTDAMVAALRRAIDTYREPERWRRVMQNGFAADFSWARAAREYLNWFAELRVQCGMASAMEQGAAAGRVD